MSEHFCSLKFNAADSSLPRPREQSVAPNTWYTIRFPFNKEPTNLEDMHQEAKMGRAYPDESSGLIWPAHTGPVGHWWAKFTLAAGDYKEVRGRYVRDPFHIASGPDQTGTEHHAPTPGEQNFVQPHMFRIKVGTPVVFQIFHNGSAARDLTLAELKLWYVT